MAWAKIDDRYDDNPKIKRAWKRHPAAVGLHTMAVTYACRHELDGVVDREWIEEKVPVKRERELVCAALLDVGLFEEHASGYLIHNFLEFNPSREELRKRREKDRARKEPRGKTSPIPPDSTGIPSGIQLDSIGPRAHPRAQDGTGRVGEVLPSDKGEDARAIFDAWVAATGRDAARTLLDTKRERLIAKALAAHGVEDCLAAVGNIGRDRWARGENDRGRRFDDVEHALGSAERIERWRDWTPSTVSRKESPSDLWRAMGGAA